MTRTSLALAATVVALAQAPNPKLTFEVASIKAAAPMRGDFIMLGSPGGPGTQLPGQVSYARTTLKVLIVQAFGIRNVQLIGPAWLDSPTPSDFWEVKAKVPEGASKEDASIMLQNLLAERFGLVAHRETREMQAYELTVAKNGPKLKESEGPEEPPPPPPQPGDLPRRIEVGRDGIPVLPAGRPSLLMMMTQSGATMVARRQTVERMATMFENELNKPVVDKTGLTGKYDFSLRFESARASMLPPPPGAGIAGPGATPSPAAAAADMPPPLQSAVQSELGLRLEQKKLAVEVLVIDRVEKTPTEN